MEESANYWPLWKVQIYPPNTSGTKKDSKTEFKKKKTYVTNVQNDYDSIVQRPSLVT